MTALLWLGACGPDLAELETREQALAQEVETLGGDVAALRARMQDLGIEPRGPSDPRAEHDLAGQIPVTATRTGQAPVFAPLPPPERRDDTTCGYRLAAGWLEALSDPALEASGSGRASPLLLLQDGRPLVAHASPGAVERDCGFTFRHGAKFLFLAPEGAPDRVSGSWTLGLAEAVPLPRGDGPPAYWVYPGTTLRFELGAGWNERDWGTLGVTLAARLMYVGTPDRPAPAPGPPVKVSFLGFEQSGADPVLELTHAPAPPDGPWTLEIASPPDGPYVLLERLSVGNARAALTVTAARDVE